MVDSQVPELLVTGHLIENNEDRWTKELWPWEFTGAPMDVGCTEADRIGLGILLGIGPKSCTYIHHIVQLGQSNRLIIEGLIDSEEGPSQPIQVDLGLELE